MKTNTIMIMIQQLGKILWAQRRTNGWIFVELVIAMCTIWFLVDKLWVDQRSYRAPLGYDTENCWRFLLGVIPEGTPNYVEPTGETDFATDIQILMDRMRQEPEIEEVCLCFWSMPYSPGNTWSSLCRADLDSADIQMESFHSLRISPTYFDLFRIRDAAGQSITAQVSDGRLVVVLSQALADHLYPNEQAVGKSISFSKNMDAICPVAAVLPHFRTIDFDPEEACSFMILTPDLLRAYGDAYGDTAFQLIELCVRMKKPMTEAEMIAFLERTGDRLQYNNKFIQGVKSMEEIRVEKMKSWFDRKKQQVGIILFVMINVFFGIVGTFWLRTERRRGEIGLRLAMGSSHRQIGQLVLLEGLILLGLTLPFLLLFVLNLAKMDLLETYREPLTLFRLVATMGISYLLLALLIALGVWYPMHKAIQLPPAEALRYE